MKTRNSIVLSGITLLIVAMMINLNVAMADTEPVGAGPGTRLEVFFLKKSFDFCDDGIGIFNQGSDIPGGAVPDGFDVQSSGCVDSWIPQGMGLEQARADNYAFTGEQIAELVVARDLSGALAIDHAIMKVDGSDVAYCNQIEVPCQRNSQTGKYYGCSWKGHVGPDFDALVNEYPTQISESTNAGFDYHYDKMYECFLTVTDDMSGSSALTVEVTDSVNDLTASTDDQMWFMNPAVSLDISLSSGSAIEFEPGYAGDTVYSLNKLMLENAAEGGVNIAVWLGGTDLTSPDMAAKCPYSNILDVEGIDQWDGMQFRCNLDNGLYVEQDWQQILNKNIKLSCIDAFPGVPAGYYGPIMQTCLGLNPLFHQHNNILVNGHEADCSFKLQYPVPCIGDFTAGNLIILMRAV